MNTARRHALTLIAILAAACSGTSGDPGGFQGAADAGDTADLAPLDPAAAAKAICARYLDCIEASAPSSYGMIAQLYGATSPCWTTTAEAREQCAKSCKIGVEQGLRVADRYPACGCRADSECKDEETPRCDVESGRCVACLEDSDCSFGLPVCAKGRTKNECVRCDATHGCDPDGKFPNCRVESSPSQSQCLECDNRAAITQCGVGVCDQYGYCRRQCSALANCFIEKKQLDHPHCGVCPKAHAYANCILTNCPGCYETASECVNCQRNCRQQAPCTGDCP